MAGGLLVGLFTTVMVSTFPWTFTILVFVGLLVITPVFVLPDSMLYWLSLYLVGLPLEAGKRITNLAHDSREILTTIGLPPSGDLGIKLYPTDFALVALVVPWIFALATRRERLYFPRVGFFLLAYLLWATLSAVVKADYFALSLAQVVHEWKYFLVYVYVCNNVKTPRALRITLGVLTLVLLTEAGVTVGLDVLGQSRDSLLQTVNLTVAREFDYAIELEAGAIPKASGTFGSASHLAMYLQLLFGLALALTFMAPTAAQRRLHFGLFVISGAAMFLTASRSGGLGFAVGAVVCLALLRRRGVLSRRQVVGIAYLAIALAAAGGTYVYAFMTSRPETFANRFGLMKEGLRVAAENPLLGVGPNNGTAARLELANRLGFQQRLNPDVMPTYDHFYPVHNHFIVLAGETGLVGFLLYLAFFVGLMREALRRSRSPALPVALLAIGAATGYAALATHLLGDHFVGNASHSLLFVYAGLLMAFTRDLPTSRNS